MTIPQKTLDHIKLFEQKCTELALFHRVSFKDDGSVRLEIGRAYSAQKHDIEAEDLQHSEEILLRLCMLIESQWHRIRTVKMWEGA